MGVGAKELKAAGTAWGGGSSDLHKAAQSARAWMREVVGWG